MTPAPKVMEPVTIPVQEETLTPAEPEPELKVESKPELVDMEPPVVEPVEVDATVEPTVSHQISSSSHECFLTSICCYSRSILPRTNRILWKVCHPLGLVE